MPFNKYSNKLTTKTSDELLHGTCDNTRTNVLAIRKISSESRHIRKKDNNVITSVQQLKEK